MAVLVAIIVILTVFNIGNIPIGPIVATIYQVPVIIGAVVLGTGAGAVLGGIWGVLCFILAITGQTTDIVALAVVQQNVFLYFIIAFVPRVMVGVVSGLVFRGFNSLLKEKKTPVSYGAAGILGSLTNTVFYLGALYVFIRNLLASLYGIEVGAVGKMILGVAGTNGLVEAAVSCLIVAAVCTALEAVGKSGRRA